MIKNLSKETIWGSKCICGADCYIFQSHPHPWQETDYIIETICPECGKKNQIDQKKASLFYSSRILSLFDNIMSRVIDFGCGGGFLTAFAASQPQVNQILALDSDGAVHEQISRISAKAQFVHGSVFELQKMLTNQTYEELICRDVLMFLDNIENFVEVTTSLLTHRIRLLNWYKPSDARIKNTLDPYQIKDIFCRKGWDVSLSFPRWYAYGYFLDIKNIRCR